jgi:hypothetical protein
MPNEFLLVTFPEVRNVLTDGNVVGKTNRTLLLPSDEYMVSLSGTGYSPAEQDLVLAGTSMQNPKVVTFELTADAAAPMAKAKAPQAGAKIPTTKTKTKKKKKKSVVKTKTATKKKAGTPAAPRRRQMPI